MTFFSILPVDLLLEQSLYFNYPDTQTYCSLLKFCDSVWLYKIRKELNFDDFRATDTVLPLHLKYLELKSITGVDFGSEYFVQTTMFIRRAVRVKDVDLRRNLVDHFFSLPTVVNLKNSFYRPYISDVLQGALAVNDSYLYQKYLDINAKRDPNWEVLLNIDYIRTSGYAEAGNLEEAEEARHDDIIITLEGLVRGGHLELLKKYIAEIRLDQLLIMLNTATLFGQRHTLEYLLDILLKQDNYPQREIYDFLSVLIRNNHPQFTMSIIRRLPVIVLKHVSLQIDAAASVGLISIMKDLSNLNSSQQVYYSSSYNRAWQYNHIDTLIYISKITNDIPYVDDGLEVILHPVIVELELKNNLIAVETIDELLHSSHIYKDDCSIVRQLIDKYMKEESKPIIELFKNIRESRKLDNSLI